MGIFSRFRDIVNANLNAMLEKAEDPEKLIKLMIQEMEDTLVEIKASCAGAMASRKRVRRALEETKARAEEWERKARLALEKGREDLAKEALIEKRNYREEIGHLEREDNQFGVLISQYHTDIGQLEEKLAAGRNKHRVLTERAIHAQRRKRAQTGIRHAESHSAFVRFEGLEHRIERIEAEADLVNYRGKPKLEDEFAKLETGEEIDEELAALKKRVAGKNEPAKTRD